MHVALTGATGFIGSHILTELREHDHEVTALVRDDGQANVVTTQGATSAVVDLHDQAAVVDVLRTVDGAIHTASPGDDTSANLNAAAADAAIAAFAGTGKPYLQISGVWVYGNNDSITEESPFHAPPMVAWREPIERRVLAARDMRGVVIVLLLDQRVDATKARTELDWHPSQPGLVDELRRGTYRQSAAP
jgi:NAD(P)-dependent dehydrogenase (short-subunit alcohol dehydrogenase family)